MIELSTREEYDLAVERGFTPLMGHPFVLPIQLRDMIQKELFKCDEDFYHYFFEHHPTQTCEEHGHPIHEYSAKNVSHILTRGGHPEMRYDLRNANLLCLLSHQEWESEKNLSMNIYKKNRIMMDKLRDEYNELKVLEYYI